MITCQTFEKQILVKCGEGGEIGVRVHGRMIMKRRKYNPKRRLHDGLDPARAHFLAESITYVGSPHHKRTPGDFGLTPPSSPRPGKTLCDGVGIFQKNVARKLLKKGAANGLVSSDADHNFPRYIWIVTDGGDVLEARCDDTARGTYHGYPLVRHDPIVELVMKRWRELGHE